MGVGTLSIHHLNNIGNDPWLSKTHQGCFRSNDKGLASVSQLNPSMQFLSSETTSYLEDT